MTPNGFYNHLLKLLTYSSHYCNLPSSLGVSQIQLAPSMTWGSLFWSPMTFSAKHSKNLFTVVDWKPPNQLRLVAYTTIYWYAWFFVCAFLNMFQVVASQVAYFVYWPWLCGTVFSSEDKLMRFDKLIASLSNCSYQVLIPSQLFCQIETPSPLWWAYIENRKAGL